MLTALTGWFVEFDGEVWHNIADDGQDSLISRDVELMQFTGLHDKNGVEIYEGDVLCWPHYENTKNQTRWVVEGSSDSAGWSVWSPRRSAEVIGNIYENPELLK